MKQARKLRSYERMARVQHFCCECKNFIFPGETYVGEVWVFEGGLDVRKYHVSCPDWPDDDGWYDRRKDEPAKVISFSEKPKHVLVRKIA